MAKNKFWSTQNVLITLKAIVVSLLTGVAGLLFFALGYWLINMQGLMVLGRVVQFLWLVFALFLWGYFANKFWKWK